MKTIRILPCLIIASMFCSGANLYGAPFMNGSFESPGLPGATTSEALIGGDIVEGWDVPISGGLAYVKNGNAAGTDALAGTHFVEFGLAGETGGQLSRTFTTVTGMAYEVVFWVTQTQGEDPTDQAVAVEAFDEDFGLSLAPVVETSIPPHENQWSQGTAYRFTATSTSTRLTFTDTTVTAGLPENWALDGVVVIPLGGGESGKIVYQQFTTAFVNDSDGRGVELVLMNAGGGNRTVIAGSEFSNYGYAALTADGTHVAFVARQGLDGPKLWVMKAEPLDPMDNPAVMVRENVSPLGRICWSPNGRRLAFADAFDPQIYVLETVDGGGNITPEGVSNMAVKVTSVNPQAQNPAWSPDGRFLAYSDSQSLWALEIQNGAGMLTPESTESNAPKKVTGGIFVGNDFPAWSPDGTRIILSSLLPAPPGIPDKTDIAFLTVREPLAAGGDILPVADDGFNDGRVSLFRDQSGGWNPDYVHEAPNYVSEPSWSTDGSRVIYGYRFAGVPELNTLFSINPALEDVITNPSVALTEITSFGTGVPGGRRASFQPGQISGPPAVLPVPEDFFIVTGEPGDPWTFTATLDSAAAGLFLRVQSTLTPDNEGSWTDLLGGGQMTRNGSLWTLDVTLIPAGTRFFRVVAAATGLQDTKTQFSTSFDVVSPGRILYTRGSFGSSELVLMEADGSDKVVLTDNTFSPLRCAMSPNGLMVAFTTFSGELFLMKAEPMNGTTNVPVNILEDSSSDVHFNAIPAWSPNGIHIAYADSSSHIQVIAALDETGAPLPFDASTNPLIDVYSGFSGEPNHAWSPNGKYLAVTEGSVIQAFQVMDGAGDIIPATGTSMVSLTLSSDFATQKKSIAWSADGSQIAFVEENPSTGAARVSLLTVDTGSGALIPEHATNNPRLKLTPTLVTSHAPQYVSWSPDGTLLALETDDAGTHRIEVIKPEVIDETLNPLVPITLPGSEGNAFQPVFRQPKTALAISQLVAFQAANYAGNEDDEEPITVRVVRTGLTTGEIEVPFTVTAGTAIEGLDFTLSDSPLVFADGESEKTIIVTPLLDAEDQEIDETLVLTLVAPLDVDLGGIPSTTVTIGDSDSSVQPFTPPCNEFTVAVNGKLLKTGTGKSGDTLSFKARQEQGWALADIQVKVQYTTNPKDAGSWLNLPEPLLSRSTNTSLTWVGETRKFPVGKLYFRTRSYALKHRSNAGPVVGPITINAAPVLELTMKVATDSDLSGLTVKPSEFITYSIKCKNIGTATATKVLLNSRLPQSTRFDSASHAIAPYFKELKGANGVTTDTQWNVGNINAGAEVNEFLTVQVNSVEQIDYNRLIQNDRLTYKIGTGKEVFMPIFRTTVSPPIKITAAKDKSMVVAGDLITYTLTIRNEASYIVTGGKVTDQVPTGARLITAAYGSGNGNYLGVGVPASDLTAAPVGLTEPGFTPHNGMLTWNVGDIEAGGSRQLCFTVRVAYDLFEKLTRNGESFDVQIQNLNFDFTGTPPSGGVLAARGGYIPFSDIARTFVSAVPPTLRPEIGLQKLAVSDTVTKLGSSDIAGIFVDGRRQIEYEIGTWNYGTATAAETEIYDGVPFETEINADNPIIGSAFTDTFTSEVPHKLTVGQKVRLPYLTGGAGLTMTTIYFVKTVPSATEFTLSKTATGVVLNFTADVTAGTLRRFVYDTDAFMRKFSINGTVQNSSADFLFFDVNGSQLAPGGEPFIDRDNDGIIDTVGKKDLADFAAGKSEFIDQNGNGKYDGPEAIRTFSYDLGDLPPMTAPNTHKLTYRVQLTPKVARGEYIAALSSAVHKKGAGLELTCPDFYYPVIGTPPIEFAKVVAKLEFAMERPSPRDNGFIGGTPGVYQVAYDFKFTNKGDFFANDTQLRIPIPPGFTTPSGRQPIDKRNATYDAAITGSPGTAVFDIGEVAPGATVTRQLVLNMTVPIPPALLVKGQLKNYSALIAPRVVATKVTTTSISAPPPAGKKASTTAHPPTPVVAKMNADGSFTITTPIQQTPAATRVFIGRISLASVQEDNLCHFFIFFGNMGDEISGAGEVAMQVPYGTRLVSADPLGYSPVGADNSQSAYFNPGHFKIEQIAGKRRLEDGTVDVVRWKFANIPPSAIYCVQMIVHVNRIFPGSSIIDKSAYISVANAAAKSASPITIKVLKDSSGEVDWWQSVGDVMQGIGNFVDDSLRIIFGDFTKQITFDSNIVSLGGADFVQMDNGTLVIPLGRGRSAIIGPFNLLDGKMPEKSFIVYPGSNPSGIALAAGATTGQQVLVGGSTNAYRNVQQILTQLHTANSIVAGGGGNIVAAGGGNIVAAGGGNIVAAGGGNVVSNDGAGLAPLGFINFANPPSIVAAGGGNIVAAGGGNIVAGGGGNIVAAGGGNIVAAGGGNIVAAGGGNIVEIGSKQIPPFEMAKIINTLVGLDGASLADVVLQKDIGNVVSNDGAGVVLDPEALANQDALSLIGNDGAGLQGAIGDP